MRPLSSLKGDPRNPKAHDLDLMDRSVAEYGFIETIVLDDRTGLLVSGHGRTATLTGKRDRGEEPPEGVIVRDDGEWLVPVTVGWASADDLNAAGALIALNHTGEVGGWVDESLLTLLDDLRDAGTLDSVGFSLNDIEALRQRLDGLDSRPDHDPDKYTRKVDVPHYEMRGDNPPVDALTDLTRTKELLAHIDAAPIPEDVRQFLRLGATRHTVFNYAAIAEFYAHAAPEVQRLMEESALVIIDFDDAVRLGYVTLSDELAKIRSEDLVARGVKIGVLDEETGNPLEPEEG